MTVPEIKGEDGSIAQGTARGNTILHPSGMRGVQLGRIYEGRITVRWQHGGFSRLQVKRVRPDGTVVRELITEDDSLVFGPDNDNEDNEDLDVDEEEDD